MRSKPDAERNRAFEFCKGLLRASVWLPTFAAIILLLVAANLEANSVWSHLTRDVGVAVLVATLIAVVFDERGQDNFLSVLEDKISAMNTNVFSAAFATYLPNELSDRILFLMRTIRIVRHNFTIHYLMENVSVGTDQQKTECVCVNATVNFVLKNVSVVPVTVPFGVGLPDPIEPAMRALVQVKSYAIDGKEYKSQQADLDLAAALASGEYVSFYKATTLPVEPGQELKVSTRYRMVKEIEDTEVLTSTFASKGIQVIVQDNRRSEPAETRTVHGNAVGDYVLQDDPDPSKGTYQWRTDDWLLPAQGVKFWWKKR